MKHGSKLKALIPLRHKVTVYVPSTVDVDQVADTSEWVSSTAKLLAESFGGSTFSPAVGCWMSPNAGLVRENTTLVFAYADSDGFHKHIDSVIEHCELMRNSLMQEAVALEVDSEMYLI